jgi:hypothetical protein
MFRPWSQEGDFADVAQAKPETPDPTPRMPAD